MVESKDVIGWIVTLGVGLLGLLKFSRHIKQNHKSEKHKVKQSIRGNNNILVGGSVGVTIEEEDTKCQEQKDK